MVHTWAADGCSRLWQAPSKSIRYNSYVPRWFWYLRLVNDTNYMVNYIQLLGIHRYHEIDPSTTGVNNRLNLGLSLINDGQLMICSRRYYKNALGIIIIFRNPDIRNQGITVFTKRLNDAGGTMGTLGRASPWQSS